MTQPKEPRTRLDPEVRRHQIIEAAARTLRGRDPVEVTFEEIAEAAGVSRALVYNYFGDRGGLLAAVYLHTFGTLLEGLNATIAAELPPADRIKAIVRGYLRFAVEHPEVWHLLQRTAAVSHPAVIEARDRHMVELASWWGGSPYARIAAYGVVGLLEAATLDWLSTDDADLEVLTDVLFDLVWFGLSSLDRYGIALPSERATLSVPT